MFMLLGVSYEWMDGYTILFSDSLRVEIGVSVECSCGTRQDEIEIFGFNKIDIMFARQFWDWQIELFKDLLAGIMEFRRIQ